MRGMNFMMTKSITNSDQYKQFSMKSNYGGADFSYIVERRVLFTGMNR